MAIENISYFLTYQRNNQYRKKLVKSINNIIIDLHPVEWLINNSLDEIVILFWIEIEISEQQRENFDKETFTLLLNE